ncbi:MAG: signal peptidase II [Candidatus Enteromonas sp.]|nr:signal peptidase II [Candidatus Enteromonas sp.]
MEENKKQKSPTFYLILFGAIAFALVILDFVTKWVAHNILSELPNQTVAVIDGFFYFSLSYNTKAAFSIGLDGVFGRILGISVSLIMSAAIIAYMVIGRKKQTPFFQAILALLAAGAVGNLIDRTFYFKGIVGFDGVIDFIQFYLGGGPSKPQNGGIPFNPFPTFNMADSYLVIGIILFIVYLILDSINEAKEKKKEEESPIIYENPMPKGSLSEEKKEDGKED